jgi:thiamine biosynthesis lipoprotein
MGSDAHVVVVGGPPRGADAAKRRIDDLECRWSRFLPDSEVCAVNRGAGSAVRVSPDTILLVRRALEGWRLSGGAFDPTVLGPVVRAGYDRSFDELPPGAPPGRSALDLGAAGIEVFGDSVRVPAGTGFDPGGIGKGLAADLVCADLLAAGAEGVCVNLGGDVRVCGTGPDGGAWTVAVDHEWSAEPVALLGLADGAVATSTTLRRRWRAADGVSRHHIVDPQTGLPSDTDVTLATVVAATAWVAEVLAKAVLLGGAATPFDILGGTGAQGLVVDDGGRVTATPGLAAFLGGASLPAAVGRSPAMTQTVPSHDP